jgi:hypothetical protein
VPDHELVIRVTAPTAENGEHWATTIRDLVQAEHGDSMRLAFDGPRVVGPAGADRIADLHADRTDAIDGQDRLRAVIRQAAGRLTVATQHAPETLRPRLREITDLLAGAEVTDDA